MYLGIDFGTSGCRAVVINAQREVVAEARQTLPSADLFQGRIQQDPVVWLHALNTLLDQLSSKLDLSVIRRLAIDGTSGTVLLTDTQGKALSPALMYNDSSSEQAVKMLKRHCPSEKHLCLSVNSGLARALQLIQRHQHRPGSVKILNQADYLSNWLCGRCGISDYHNALKLGYDVQHLQWPSWVINILPQNALPEVVEPGSKIGHIQAGLAQRFGFSNTLIICAGSTDANAAFIATGSIKLGNAVTSLGSTLVLKILNDKKVESLDAGVYSHRLGDYWLTGGASNAGAAILSKYFTNQQIIELSKQITLNNKSTLNYYPLLSEGERFPVYDPHKKPQLTPRPGSDVEFIQGLLEGLSAIEQQGYEKLTALGTINPNQVLTSGGGANNPQWQALRQKKLGVPVSKADQTEASYGAALLALEGLAHYIKH
jgi:sugar (pentulose or hexulose) kinase